jgi:LacI family transcriptional regulator
MKRYDSAVNFFARTGLGKRMQGLQLQPQARKRRVMAGKSTLEDVARQAGVSIKTVSRVVNGEPHVSQRVRETVEHAIAELNYRPNAAARALASGRSLIIGMLSPALGGTYYRRLNSEVLGACRERGYHLLIEQLNLDARASITQVNRFTSGMHLDGVLLAPGVSDSTEILDVIRSANIRAVAISPRATTADLIVTADEAQGERELADAFWALGHRRFAIAQPPAFWRLTRGEAFARRLMELGAGKHGITYFPFDWRIPALEGGRRMAIDILASNPRPTAVFAASDELAAGAIGLCLTHGVNVPAEISIAGFDDDEIAQATWPALTTIRQPLGEMIGRAMDLLVGNERAIGKLTINCPVQLVMRGSVAANPSVTAADTP